MWLTLAITILTYLMSPRDTPKERRGAMVNALVAGGATYAATEYTDWGKDVSAKFDSAIGVAPSGTPGVAANGDKAGETGTGVSSQGGGLWSSVSGWGAAGAATLVGAAGVSAITGSTWILPAALAIGAYLILRK